MKRLLDLEIVLPAVRLEVVSQILLMESKVGFEEVEWRGPI